MPRRTQPSKAVDLAFDGLERLVRNLLIDNVNFRTGHYFAAHPTSSDFVRNVLKDQAEAILERLSEVRSVSVAMAADDEPSERGTRDPDGFLLDLAGRRSAVDHGWTSSDCYDPPHGRTEVSYAKARGWIDAIRRDDNSFLMRLSAKGVEALGSWPAPRDDIPGTTVEKARELVSDLLPDGPADQEKWLHRSDFDAPPRLEAVDAAHANGWIEIDDRHDEANMLFRLTLAGLERLSELGTEVAVPPRVPC